eukprot:2381666-Alexandrium_andersonii.AAC.1
MPPAPDSAEAWRVTAQEAWDKVEAWARTLPAVPPGSATGSAGRAALAALAAWPPHVIAAVWKPLADWLEG